MQNPPQKPPGAFRPVPRTGVIYVMTEATKRGFSMNHPDWCNLGQGQPDTGELPGAPPRKQVIEVSPDDQDYAPVGGMPELREAVASLYNALFRRGMKSQYTAENVSISGGGRVSLMRACTAVGQVNLGHFLPDYTAYEELLDIFRRFTPIPILLDPERHYEFSSEQLEREILGRGLGAILMSNPCNPTGKLVAGADLDNWVGLARSLDCTLLLDEFYSHYVWQGNDPIVSAAQYVENVDRDPVVIFDGLTKNWRYPGWRVTWTVGPKQVIEAITSAGSFLDGGGSAPMQRAAAELLTVEHARAETGAIRTAFRAKRDLLLDRLKALGVRFDLEPQGTFYAWGDLSGLPPTLNTGQAFFQAALERKVITVPGTFFDVDPGQRRLGRPSRFRHHIRFSFGPDFERITTACDRLAEVVSAA
ncbi:MAG: pyridoxal phosphate-dependent aminotransferase [Myxococcales bacterium]|nr:pyridoxal phosphate-dependent aminotransferase [Myxococcales bacterium]MDD9971117.1 pyridoxal phosphate-dependent aminotransferase [Myxococcales bacterium]